eukprot:scaffold70218_cov17-Prasinocladus_malaysianus.AAC.1
MPSPISLHHEIGQPQIISTQPARSEIKQILIAGLSADIHVEPACLQLEGSGSLPSRPDRALYPDIHSGYFAMNDSEFM